MNAIPVADAIRTRDLLAFARKVQADGGHSVYQQANRAERRENDFFIRMLESSPDMSLAGLTQRAQTEARVLGVDGALGFVLGTGLMVSATLGPSTLSLPLMIVGMGIEGISIGLAGRVAADARFAAQLQDWQSTLQAASQAKSTP